MYMIIVRGDKGRWHMGRKEGKDWGHRVQVNMDSEPSLEGRGPEGKRGRQYKRQ